VSDLDPFISTTDLEALLGEPLADPTGLIVKIALDSACHTIRTYLGQDINLVLDDSEIHSGSGRRKMRLRQRPVREVTEVWEDDALLEVEEYTVRDNIITRTQGGFWAYGNDNIEVIYSHGWDIDETPEVGWDVERVPADIRLVALLAARRVFLDTGEDLTSGAIVSETIGDYSYQLSDAAVAAVSSASGLLEPEQGVLDRWKIGLSGGDTPTY
jgi:hypothetical protein